MAHEFSALLQFANFMFNKITNEIIKLRIVHRKNFASMKYNGARQISIITPRLSHEMAATNKIGVLLLA